MSAQPSGRNGSLQLDTAIPMKLRSVIAMVVCAGASSACALPSVQVQKPQWFDEKSRQVKGEGYPKLADVPRERGASTADPVDWTLQRSDLRKQAETMRTDPKSAGPDSTPEDIRAKAAQLRAIAEAGGGSPPAATTTPPR